MPKPPHTRSAHVARAPVPSLSRPRPLPVASPSPPPFSSPPRHLPSPPHPLFPSPPRRLSSPPFPPPSCRFCVASRRLLVPLSVAPASPPVTSPSPFPVDSSSPPAALHPIQSRAQPARTRSSNRTHAELHARTAARP
ncbi:unnamed protein product [Closterium sp. NIES-54]